MSLALHGLSVTQGIAIGKAVCLNQTTIGLSDLTHHVITPAQIPMELEKLHQARQQVCQDLVRLQKGLQKNLQSSPTTAAPTSTSLGHRRAETPPELVALLDVHVMMLQDASLMEGIGYWIRHKHYSAAWAVNAQLGVLCQQFDEMQDPYLRERKADVEQVLGRLQVQLKYLGQAPHASDLPSSNNPGGPDASCAMPADSVNPPACILVAHDLSPADMLLLRTQAFVGFLTDTGGVNSHLAILARSLSVPAVLGLRQASHWIQADDDLIIDGHAGVVLINPDPKTLAYYQARQQDQAQFTGLEQTETHRYLDSLAIQALRDLPAVTLDGQVVELLGNIELPQDVEALHAAGAQGVGLFRTEFLFMQSSEVTLTGLPDEETQYCAYTHVVQAMKGLPVTIRTIDSGADKPLALHHEVHAAYSTQLNPALGQRAIRWSLAEPAIFLMQLRAILRAAAHGPIKLLIPMLSHVAQLRQVRVLLEQAQMQLIAQRLPHGHIALGAMVEVPAMAISLPLFLPYIDFLSIGSNDLTQYTLAIDRCDEAVATLYDPLHPAVLSLIAQTIEIGTQAGKAVSLCGELAGDPELTRLLLGLGLRSFSMSANQIPAVKACIRETTLSSELKTWASQALRQEVFAQGGHTKNGGNKYE